MTENRINVRKLALQHLLNNEPLSWFEKLYAMADGDAEKISWADMVPNPNLVEWLDRGNISGSEKKALKVGCGLGDDAEELAHRGFDVIAFDISPTAIEWCKSRFTDTTVTYVCANLLDFPSSWSNSFDFVLESYTLQVLPHELRGQAIKSISDLVAPDGILLVICRGRDINDRKGDMPWPLVKDELLRFEECGLTLVQFEDFLDREKPPVRRFRATYKKPGRYKALP